MTSGTLRLSSNRSLSLSLLLLVLGGSQAFLTGGCAVGPQYNRPAVFQGYPADPALDRIVDMHVEAGRNPREARLLLTTWFQDGTPSGSSQICSVRPSGRLTTYQYVHEMSLTPPRVSDLPPETLSLIQTALATLPPTQHPALANMLIVSYWLDGKWQTRLYDRTRRPPGMSTVFELTGAPILPSP